MCNFEISPHLDLQKVAVARLILHARIILLEVKLYFGGYVARPLFRSALFSGEAMWQLKRRPDFRLLIFRKAQEVSN